MNIVIAGLGKFGKELTENLAKEGHNIIVIDTKSNEISNAVNRYDVMGVCGNSASYNILKDASVQKADLFIATTSTDELNILSCLVAKKLGVKQTIARVRNPEYSSQVQLMSNELGINITELKTMYEGIEDKDRVGFCLDTCHMNDSGINISEFDVSYTLCLLNDTNYYSEREFALESTYSLSVDELDKCGSFICNTSVADINEVEEYLHRFDKGFGRNRKKC